MAADLLAALVQVLEKLARKMVITFSASNTLIALNNADDIVELHCNLQTNTVFSGFRIESRTDNTIYMECSIQQLVSAFQAGTSSDSCSIRLTKKAGIPYLTFTAETAGQVAIVQDVPCRIMTVDEAHRFREPDLPLPEVRLGIHDFKTMKSVVDRMQTIGKLLTVEADMGGNLTLSVATELVAAKSYFRDLKAHAGDDEAAGPSLAASVDIRKLSKAITCSQNIRSKSMLCIARGSAVIIHHALVGRWGAVTIFIPIVGSGDN